MYIFINFQGYIVLACHECLMLLKQFPYSNQLNIKRSFGFHTHNVFKIIFTCENFICEIVMLNWNRSCIYEIDFPVQKINI